MCRNTSQCRERQVRDHYAPELSSERLEECRQLNLDQKPFYPNAEVFRVPMPNGKVMEVHMREVVPSVAVCFAPLNYARPEMDAVLSAVSTLHLLIDHE